MLWFKNKKKIKKTDLLLFGETKALYPEIYRCYGVLPAIDSFIIAANIPSNLVGNYRVNYVYAISKVTFRNLLGTTRINQEVISCIFQSERKTTDRKLWERFIETQFTHNVVFGFYHFDGSWVPLLEFSANFSIPGLDSKSVAVKVGKEFTQHILYPDFKIIKPQYLIEPSTQSQMFWLNLHQLEWQKLFLSGKL